MRSTTKSWGFSENRSQHRAMALYSGSSGIWYLTKVSHWHLVTSISVIAHIKLKTLERCFNVLLMLCCVCFCFVCVLCLCVHCISVCVHMHTYEWVSEEATRLCWISWSWNYRCLSLSTWMLRTKLQSSPSVAKAVNCGPGS